MEQLQHLAFRTDSTIKGFERGSPWDLLDQLVLLLARGPEGLLQQPAS